MTAWRSTRCLSELGSCWFFCLPEHPAARSTQPAPLDLAGSPLAEGLTAGQEGRRGTEISGCPSRSPGPCPHLCLLLSFFQLGLQPAQGAVRAPALHTVICGSHRGRAQLSSGCSPPAASLRTLVLTVKNDAGPSPSRVPRSPEIMVTSSSSAQDPRWPLQPSSAHSI